MEFLTYHRKIGLPRQMAEWIVEEFEIQSARDLFDVLRELEPKSIISMLDAAHLLDSFHGLLEPLVRLVQFGHYLGTH